MKIVKVYDVPEATNPHKVSMRPLHDTPHVQVNIFDLKPGEALKMHTTPVDAFFYILEGRGVVEIGGEQQEVSADMLVDSPARIPHLLKNTGESVFRFLVIKTPRQAGPTQFNG
jgi:mannose-6-phosphate isomerase-like protein (cupin superfamily)